MSTSQPAPPLPSGPFDFYRFALEYYVSGRASLLCRNSFVTCNLLHHAVEMLLKGQLSKTIPLAELKNRFYHRLLDLWPSFKALFPTTDLTEFDGMITELEKFEEIRYPDKIILGHGVHIGLGPGRGVPVTIGGKPPEYWMGVGDVDAFFARLFPLCGINPPAYLGYLSPLGRQVLTEGNAESKDWLS
jgi:hypothetical protein